ncbi:helix-turn-helix domain-containing protein [Nonomuraea typhae]|uniref:helix-turn-helix domain-containing protein n=1 Tax=Nonomuraea typhae TaxID=2603600 RepID=UPI0012FB339A|nr:helix-turn-helix domain-containing protein [Nonomuraea typhae]
MKGTELLVLLRLANSAGADHRMTWLGVESLCREVRASRSTVYAALAKLADRGILQEVAEDHWPGEARGYLSVVRRITTPDFWDENCPAPPFRAGEVSTRPESGPVDTSQRQPVPTRPESGPKTKNPIHLETSSLDSYAAPAARRAATTPKMRHQQMELDDEHDPAVAAGVREPRPPRQQRTRRAPGPDTGLGLAAHFARAMTGSASDGFPAYIDVANQTKLAGAFNRWMRQGAAPDQIRDMIAAYATVPGYRSDSAVPWTDFLAKRALLWQHITRARSAQAAQQFRPEEWSSGLTDDQPFNPDDWTSL